MKSTDSEQIKLGEYPYTYVRVVAMKSKLLKKMDYDRLMKMDSDGIAAYLQDSSYTGEINELANISSGFDLIEQSLSLSLARTFSKLRNISPPELALLIKIYLKRNDYYNMKTVIRGKFSGQKNDETEKMLIPAGELPKEVFMKILSFGSIEEMLKNFPPIKFRHFKEALSYFNEHNSLMLIENVFDQQYFSAVFKFLSMIPVQGELFKELLRYELDVINIKLLLKLKLHSTDAEKIKSLMLCDGKMFSRGKLRHLAALSIENMLDELSRTKFGSMIKEQKQAVLSEKSLSGLEVELDKFLIGIASQLIHQHPLSIDIILGFMFAKEIEVRNLKIITKGKQLGVNEELITKQLVV